MFLRLPKVHQIVNDILFPDCCLTRLSPRFIVNRVQIKFMNRDSIDCSNSIDINVLIVFCSCYSVLSSSRYTPCFKIPVDRRCIRGTVKRTLDYCQFLSGRYMYNGAQDSLALKKHVKVKRGTQTTYTIQLDIMFTDLLLFIHPGISSLQLYFNQHSFLTQQM